MKQILRAALLATVFAACGGGDDDAASDDEPIQLEVNTDAAPCDEAFAEGAPVDLEAAEKGCADEGGGMAYLGVATTDCVDGRVLLWNDAAWGYEGDVWHVHEKGAEQVAPDAEIDACDPE